MQSFFASVHQRIVFFDPFLGEISKNCVSDDWILLLC